MPATLRKLLSLDARSLVDLLRAQAALFRARHRVRTSPIGSLTTKGNDDRAEAAGDAVRARALALAVGRAAEHGIIRPLCLVRALALRDLLDREGIVGSEIRIGVRRRRGELEAHAWVLWGQEVLGDAPEHVRTFQEVDDIRVLGPQ